jgi:ferric-dicitrate binding protein FerR (iron transport regulator)
VYLNSGTEMDFPSTFANHSREIWVEGEIFIDVAHQRGTPFVIHTPNSEIIVYGTSFNVTSYSDESRESVVLVNGSVEVKSMNSSIRLKPNEMAVIENGALMRKEVDVSAYISWKKGYLQLSKTPLNEVLQQIGRYYNVEFRYPHNLSLGERTCSGKLYLSDNLEDVLKAFSKLTFLTYEINKETINIKQ